MIKRATVLSEKIIDLDDIYLNSPPSIGKIVPARPRSDADLGLCHGKNHQFNSDKTIHRALESSPSVKGVPASTK